jgi:hypothetical protein
MINSDAHKPHELESEFEYGFSMLKAAGINEVVYFKGKGWGFDPVI